MVITTDPKHRFEHRDDQVRAVYGHSVDVHLELTDPNIPRHFYYESALRNLRIIIEEGVKLISSQFAYLAKTPEEGRTVSMRYITDPVALVIDVRGTEQDGFDTDERGHSLYTADVISSEYIG